MTYAHTPGSFQAVIDGCQCPIMDNGNGAGAYVDHDGNRVFWYSAECPLHGPEANDVAPDTLLSPLRNPR